MSRAGKFIPGGARKSGPMPAGSGRTGPIRGPADPADPAGGPAPATKKLFPKGGLGKPVPKHQRRPITLMSAIVCGLLVWAAQYIRIVRPGQIREQQALIAPAAAQKQLKQNEEEQKKQAELAVQNAGKCVVKIDTKPSGAGVTVGAEHKTTPATFTTVTAGDVMVAVHLDGYEDYTQKVTAKADKPVDLGVVPLVQSVGNLALTSPQSGVTYVLTGPGDYRHEGAVPDKLADLPVGDYQLVAKQHDWKLPPVTVTVRVQDTAQQVVKFPYASVALDSVPPGATVRRGRAVLGQTPLTLNEQRPGPLHLSFDLEPYSVQRLDLDLPEFGSVSKSVTLVKEKNFIAASGIPMIWIPAGFWAGKYPVSQSQFEPVAKYNPSFFRKPNRPVENISWDNAVAFCEKLTEYERKAGKLPSGYHYALPTESQWSAFSADADIEQAAMSRATSLLSTQDVGTSEPNKYGLYDTLGNVWEWCLDTVDDRGNHSLRGGSWLSSADNFPTPETRIIATPKNADRFTGFRVVLVPQ